MNIRVDKDLCIGCGTCTAICPEVFEMGEDNKAIVKESINLEEHKDKINEVVNSCPTNAIVVED